ncbi:MAG: thioesterase family protein [Niabella sp.]
MEKQYVLPLQIRWADLDVNGHLRHTVYYDWGSFCRISFLNQHGLTLSRLQELQIGPILFSENCHFKKEIFMEDEVTINLELLNAKRSFIKWSIRHQIIKNEMLAAELVVVGSWIHNVRRRVVMPPQQAVDVYNLMPRAKDFEWLD